MRRKYLVTYRNEDGRGYIGADGIGSAMRADCKPIRLTEAVAMAERFNNARRGFTSFFTVVSAPRVKYRDRRPNLPTLWQMGR